MVTYKETLNEFLGKCKEKFGKDLVSVVLFGSVAKGTAKEYSDIDLLIVAKELPPFEERIPLISDLCYEMLIKYKVSISPILMTPEEFDKNISAGFPLFLGVIMGYKPIFDKNRFSANLLTKFSNALKKEGARFKDGVWFIPKMALG